MTTKASDISLSSYALSVDNIRIDGNTISSTNTNGDISLTPNGAGNVGISGDLLIQKNNAWLTVDSPSTGGEAIEQGAGVSIGESGYKGSAALHLTYTGDGYSHIGMGAVNTSSNLPEYRAMRMYYTNNQVYFDANPSIAGYTNWHSGNDGTGSGLDADLLDGLQASQFLRSDATDSFTNLSGTSITIGSGVKLAEATDRPDLLLVQSQTSGWAGIQIDNTANETLWSVMADGTVFGVYDDTSNVWSIQCDDSGETRLFL